MRFSIEGPSEAQIECSDNCDGSARVTYWTSAAGEYAVHVICEDEDIPNSPYMANIVASPHGIDPSKASLIKIMILSYSTRAVYGNVKVYGAGVEDPSTRSPGSGAALHSTSSSSGLMLNEPANFFIDLSEAFAGVSPSDLAELGITKLDLDQVERLVQVTCHDPFGDSVPVTVKATANQSRTRLLSGQSVSMDLLSCQYTPSCVGTHTIGVALNGVGVRGMPFRL
ncbi:unnamed protein product [Protopolystoma xenopodis]|uniref:Uncharacterized protein n=1 Tax=Protopolystoma xenopodis TaxID=117903 RepID=A0A448XB10_9PLAT|nr:unnamed protein product [Protopolystoma xenopodis]